MKTTCCIILCAIGLGLASALGQPTTFGQNFISLRPGLPEQAERGLTNFDLSFPGGAPGELVGAIEKAMGRPLNVIIPTDLADTKLPALKMSHVNVAELFQALQAVSPQLENYLGPQYAPVPSYGFVTDGNPSDNSIWRFFVYKPRTTPQPKVCRFYALAPYLDGGMSVDDITTAIETGWKMLGATNTPTISFHKDTKLLIAVGEPSKLETIDAVLKALNTPKAPPAPPAPAAKPAEQSKAMKK